MEDQALAPAGEGRHESRAIVSPAGCQAAISQQIEGLDLGDGSRLHRGMCDRELWGNVCEESGEGMLKAGATVGPRMTSPEIDSARFFDVVQKGDGVLASSNSEIGLVFIAFFTELMGPLLPPAEAPVWSWNLLGRTFGLHFPRLQMTKPLVLVELLLSSSRRVEVWLGMRFAVLFGISLAKFVSFNTAGQATFRGVGQYTVKSGYELCVASLQMSYGREWFGAWTWFQGIKLFYGLL
ncbi:hypothetical protein Dimus_011038 [Dionaea muscipula]